MSDEQPGSEQPPGPAQPEPPAGDRWGNPITPERAAELMVLADQQRAWATAPDHQGRESYFQGVALTGADVFWLKEQSWGDEVRFAHRGGALLIEAHLEGARLFGAHLERAVLRNAWLDKATLLNEAALDRASLDQLSFDGANLAVVQWETVRVLGDEVRARSPKDERGERKDR